MPARGISLQACGWNCLLSVLDSTACVFLSTRACLFGQKERALAKTATIIVERMAVTEGMHLYCTEVLKLLKKQELKTFMVSPKELDVGSEPQKWMMQRKSIREWAGLVNTSWMWSSSKLYCSCQGSLITTGVTPPLASIGCFITMHQCMCCIALSLFMELLLGSSFRTLCLVNTSNTVPASEQRAGVNGDGVL